MTGLRNALGDQDDSTLTSPTSTVPKHDRSGCLPSFVEGTRFLAAAEAPQASLESPDFEAPKAGRVHLITGDSPPQTGNHSFPVRGKMLVNLPPGTGPIYVHASAPGQEPELLAVSIGGGPVQPNGDFEIDAWAEEQPEVVRLSFSDERGVFLVRDLPATELAQPLGQVLESEVEEFSVQVYNGFHQPVEGASLQILTRGPGSALVWNSTFTDATGKASFLLPSASVEYYIDKAGLRFEHGFIDWDTEEHGPTPIVTLERLRFQDLITGRTLDSQGMPVRGALISASPEGQPAGVTLNSLDRTRSDANGYFNLNVAGNTSILLIAEHSELGKTPGQVLQGGEQQVTLFFPPDDEGRSSTSLERSQADE